MGLRKIFSDITQGCFHLLDFAIPLCLTLQLDQYVLVMIEHFSKWLKLVSLVDHNNEKATYTFLDRVLNKFGALSKVLIDQGMEFYGIFQELCEKALIDHYTISQNHLEANELIE